ncbi:uncharacterized protein UTRI_06003 [Ustilago trichophora]|uniref:PUM-HD domain-containing protein n=1 Tax=Ustilago trichophora TaxID=86804 RepID=A0A5C3EHN0_9BASI|nr:uncharacterized protein UTRI_06003 [Ustilago trichophora]
MSFTFHPRLDMPSSQNTERESITPRNGQDDSGVQEESYNRDVLGYKATDVWPDAPFMAPGLDLDSLKRGLQMSRSRPLYDQSFIDLRHPSHLNRHADLDSRAPHCSPHKVAAWTVDTGLSQRRGCEKENWPQETKVSGASPAPLSAFQAYSMIPMHQRFASASSGAFGDERSMPASDPGSDFSSEYSDLFQASGLPFPPIYPGETREQTPSSAGYAETQQRPLPDFVVDELKRLKLENMALRRMAHEVVRINIGPGSLERRNLEKPAPTCTHHSPLTTPPRFQRVLEGADPMQVYHHEATRSSPDSASVAKSRDRGVSSSMWAPGKRDTAPISPREAGTPQSIGAKPFRACDISAAELGRRVAMADTDSPPVPGYQYGPGTDNPIDASLPGHLRTRTLSSTSPHSSPGSTTHAASKLDAAPASTLVSMILEKRGQEASLLLQQQLKSGNPERQDEILQAICARIVSLSHDRHGNFLVQGAIESRPETAMHLKGAFVELTMSQFGCHVVQKALEGEETVREAVTEELLGSRLDQTLTSRHSIHVWQRILETEWTRPQFREQIFASINRQLKGRWARTARQETGSIICQNIFESAQPAEKAQCMQEVLEELDECATNQWGVWVVQHIIEHGAEEERRAALRGLVRSASKLTLSQYGQKAVMSGLKTGEGQFLQDYVDVMCHSSQPRRPPLIDVCLAAHGMQIVTQLLTTVDQKTRDRIISTVRRNSVFLKGSKAGMKVHQLCERARAFAGY